jgi:hypothetical protein
MAGLIAPLPLFDNWVCNGKIIINAHNIKIIFTNSLPVNDTIK